LAAREAYDKFLARYPYCYGYWKKYADYEKRKGSAEDCEQVNYWIKIISQQGLASSLYSFKRKFL